MCTCQNHIQNNIGPTTLTTEVVLQSYQHFLQHIQQTGMTNKTSSDFDALDQYGKTIQMLILARMNGIYSPYSPQTIMEEEAKYRYGDVFKLAEKKFFKHRLLTLLPHVTEKDIETSLTFLEQQKLANCPCFVHTEQRGFDWVVFRRQPDKITSECDDIQEIEDDVTDDEDFFSVEGDASIAPTSEDELAIPTNDPQYNPGEINENPEEAPNSSGQATFASTDLSDGYKAMAKTQMSKSPHEPALHSRNIKTNLKTQNTDQKRKKKNDSKPDETPMDLEDYLELSIWP